MAGASPGLAPGTISRLSWSAHVHFFTLARGHISHISNISNISNINNIIFNISFNYNSYNISYNYVGGSSGLRRKFWPELLEAI